MVPPEQAADLRDYFNKHAKKDRLDSRILAKVPLLHPDGLHTEAGIGPGDALKRAVKIRSGLVHRRSTSMARLDALLEILGPGWVGAIGSDMGVTALRFCARYASPDRVKRLGAKRLAEFFRVSSRGAWDHERAAEVIGAADASTALWGSDGIDFEALGAFGVLDHNVAAVLVQTVGQHPGHGTLSQPDLPKAAVVGYDREPQRTTSETCQGRASSSQTTHAEFQRSVAGNGASAILWRPTLRYLPGVGVTGDVPPVTARASTL